jgi:hypothetical protein
MKKRIILLSFLIITLGINAKGLISINHKNAIQKKCNEDNSLLSKVLKQLKLTDKDIQEELCVEKKLPYNKSLSIMVIPKIATKEIDDDNNYSYEFDSYILIVENRNGNIKNKFFESDAWTSDAVVLSSIEIDTAPYFLNKNIRGFGIRVNYSGSSHPNPYGQTDFSLFINNGKSLKRVIKNFPVYEFHGEWDMNCEGEFETIESSIIIGKKQTNNFNNLIIKQKITEEKNRKIKDDCIEKKVNKTTTITLKYNNKEYK